MKPCRTADRPRTARPPAVLAKRASALLAPNLSRLIPASVNDQGPIPSQPAIPGLKASAVLGLSDRGGAEWARLRGLQYSALSGLTFLRSYSHALFAVFVAVLFRDSVSFAWIALWMAALAGVHMRGAAFDRSLGDVAHRKITTREFYRQTVTPALSGLLWAAAVVGFGPQGTSGEFGAMLYILAILIAGGVFFNTAAPLGVVVFSLIVGTGTAAALALAGEFLTMTVSIVFTIVSIIGAIESGRHLPYRAARRDRSRGKGGGRLAAAARIRRERGGLAVGSRHPSPPAFGLSALRFRARRLAGRGHRQAAARTGQRRALGRGTVSRKPSPARGQAQEPRKLLEPAGRGKDQWREAMVGAVGNSDAR